MAWVCGILLAAFFAKGKKQITLPVISFITFLLAEDKYPFDDNAFDGVYLNQSLHHVGAEDGSSIRNEKRARVFEEIFRVLKDGGKVVVVQSSADQLRRVWWWKFWPEALARKLIIHPSIRLKNGPCVLALWTFQLRHLLQKLLMESIQRARRSQWCSETGTQNSVT
jgi:SAM-dependent methyltransferase